MPRAYDMSSAEHVAQFQADFIRSRSECSECTSVLCSSLPPRQEIDGSGRMWIAKPAKQARGVGIELYDELEPLLALQHANEVFVVQKYIETPMLILNHKFDIRQFVLVASLDPLVVFVSRDCYARFSSVEYSIDSKDRFVHLTNHQVQKEYENYAESLIAENQWSFEQLEQHLRETRNVEWNERIRPAIVQLAVNAMQSWPADAHRRGNFELLGLDVLLSDSLQPYLLEVNTGPGIHLLTNVTRAHHPRAVADLFRVVLDNRALWENGEIPSDEIQRENFGVWQLVHIGTPSGAKPPVASEQQLDAFKERMQRKKADKHTTP